MEEGNAQHEITCGACRFARRQRRPLLL